MFHLQLLLWNSFWTLTHPQPAYCASIFFFLLAQLPPDHDTRCEIFRWNPLLFLRKSQSSSKSPVFPPAFSDRTQRLTFSVLQVSAMYVSPAEYRQRALRP